MPAPCPGRERTIAESVPEFARLRDTTARYGISRSGIYRHAALGDIRLVKLGNATLVDLASVRAFMARLPAATLRAPKA
jgi:predicted DNA-binding transcriptional regulator AlpA